MFGNTPPVVKNLLLINVVFFLAYMVLGNRLQGKDLNDILGLHYIGAENFKPIQFLTYMFLHHDFRHILFNMFGLWMFGRTLESVWGPKRFMIYYFVTGLGAALLQMLALSFEVAPYINAADAFLNNQSIETLNAFINSGYFYDLHGSYNGFQAKFNNLINVNYSEAMAMAEEYVYQYKINYLNLHNMVGASGAVLGILLGFGMLFPNTELYLLFIPFPIKAKWLVIGYGLFELYNVWLSQPGDNVAHIAHLGGMLFGFILIKIWKTKRDSFY